MFGELFCVLSPILADITIDVLVAQGFIGSDIHDNLGWAVAEITVSPELLALSLIHIHDVHLFCRCQAAKRKLLVNYMRS